MQQIILAAGKGTRLNMPVTNKCLVKVSEKALIDYNLELSHEINANEILVIVGHNKDSLINYIGSSYNGIPVKYIEQQPQLGIAHGIMQAIQNINGSFLMCLSDELLVRHQLSLFLKFFRETEADCVCGIVKDSDENIVKAYTVEINNQKLITRIVEKPEYMFNQYKGTGYCLMRQTMLDVLPKLKKNAQRGEYEMGDWIRLAINQGKKCYAFEIGEADFNVNEQTDIYEAENYILSSQ